MNSAEEGEINVSTEIEIEGNIESYIKREDTHESVNTEIVNETETPIEITTYSERKSERNRRRPNYYGTVRYC